MEAYQQRVVEEKDELDGRIERLYRFISPPTETYENLPEDEKIRLQDQLLYMRRYSRVLWDRIAAFEFEEEESRAAFVEGVTRHMREGAAE